MSIARLRDRVPSAKKVELVILYEHQLMFHKKSKDGSGKCDAYETGNKADYVIGILFIINPDEKHKLNDCEGLGNGYEEKEVIVRLESGDTHKAFTYYATDINPDLKPYDWYKEHVVRGAQENNLPPDYIAMIMNVESVPDPEKSRENKEMSIYKSIS